MEINNDSYKKLIINRIGRMYNICKDIKKIIYGMAFESHPIASEINLNNKKVILYITFEPWDYWGNYSGPALFSYDFMTMGEAKKFIEDINKYKKQNPIFNFWDGANDWHIKFDDLSVEIITENVTILEKILTDKCLTSFGFYDLIYDDMYEDEDTCLKPEEQGLIIYKNNLE